MFQWYLASSRWTHSTSYHMVTSCLCDFGNCVTIFSLFFLQSPHTGSNPPILASTSSSPAVPLSPQIVAPLECDWSEHTCPDGYKYYYNCVTYESRVNVLHWITLFLHFCVHFWYFEKMGKWLYKLALQWEKPEEYTSYEHLLQKQQSRQNPSHQLHSSLPVLSTERVVQTEQVPASATFPPSQNF